MPTAKELIESVAEGKLAKDVINEDNISILEKIFDKLDTIQTMSSHLDKSKSPVKDLITKFDKQLEDITDTVDSLINDSPEDE